ncbi:MAG: amidohydrolase family protein [Myxococcales bacterium]|nr:amidohydrolase family protein [Myxococcales bacterium]
MHDLVIRNGTLVDGSGGAAREADVAIDGDVITEVCAAGSAGQGRREIDARGQLVTPGFVDIHTHFDAQVTWDPYLTPSGFHGCTTVVMGSCGVGFAPARPDRHEWLIGLMEGVEDIPGSAMVEGITWGWESFGEYLDVIERSPHAIDFGCQVPHGALRAYVMGERGAKNEPATAEDIAEMRRLAADGLRAGALGISTSRTSLHKSIDGEFVPGTFATKDEVFGLGRALADAGHGVFQLAVEHTELPAEMAWMRELAREIRRPISMNLSQTDASPELWRSVLRGLEEAGQNDEPLFAQVAGRAIGVLMSLELTACPLLSQPTYLGLCAETNERRLAELRKPEVRAAIANEEPLDLGAFPNLITQTYDKMFPVTGAVDYEPARSESIGERARRSLAREGRAADPRAVAVRAREIICEALIENDGKGLLYFPLFNYSNYDLEVLRELHMHPRTRMGLSDAGAHCGAICDGGMPTFMLSHWTRDRSRGARLPLEHVVHRQTRQTAMLFGLADRGLVAPGYKADLNVIDYDKLAGLAPEVVHDLPAGGRRLLQRATGYRATVCSGSVILEDDSFTGVLPGRLLRGPRGARKTGS